MAQRDEQGRGAAVKIFGEEFRIAADDGDTEQVRRVAEFVDKKMRGIAEQHRGGLSRSRVAVLAAMEIAADLLRSAEAPSIMAEKTRENISRLSRLIEERAQLSSQRPDQGNRLGDDAQGFDR